jgi:hypothetical protein
MTKCKLKVGQSVWRVEEDIGRLKDGAVPEELVVTAVGSKYVKCKGTGDKEWREYQFHIRFHNGTPYVEKVDYGHGSRMFDDKQGILDELERLALMKFIMQTALGARHYNERGEKWSLETLREVAHILKTKTIA